MLRRKLMTIAWPAFLAACLLQGLVFGLVDPLEIPWAGQGLHWSRQAVYAAAFALFWLVAMFSSALTVLLSARPEAGDGLR